MNKKSFTVIVILLIMIIAGLCAFIAYDKDIFNVRNKNTSKNNKNETVEKIEQKEEKIDVSSEQVTTLINPFLNNTNNIYTSGTKYFGYYFQKDKLSSENVDDELILYTAIKRILNEKNITSSSQDNVSISKDELIPVIKKIFGNVEYDNKTISITPCDFGTFKYDDSTGTYTVESHGCGGASASSIKHKITNAIKKDNKIEITMAIVYVNCGYEQQEDGTIDYCEFGKSVDENQKMQESDRISKVNKADKNTDELFDFDSYINQLDKYKFTFTKDSNDNYVFTKVEKQ